MATTTNFGWTTPDNTDLVKNGALAIRTLGSAIDTSLGSAWTSYTPSFTNFTLGNGTVAAYYKQIGKTVLGYISIVFGSTTAITGTPGFSIPVAHSTDYVSNPDVGYGRYVDDNTGTGYRGFTDIDLTNDNFRPFIDNVAATYATLGVITTTIPFTWTTSDRLELNFLYEGV